MQCNTLSIDCNELKYIINIINLTIPDLSFWKTYNQAIEFIIDSNLATEATVSFGFIDQSEFLFFFTVRRAGFFEPLLINITMTGGTGHGPTTFSKNTIDHIIDSAMHQGHSSGHSDFSFCSIGIDVGNDCHKE